MNLNILRYVEAVAEEGSFTKAAQRLYVAQPSLSQSIRALERDLGAELFDRSGRAVVLTPAGERYLRWARTVLRSELKLRADLDAAPNGLRKLTIGASPYRCKALLSDAMRVFYQKNPGCRIELYDQYQNNAMLLLDEDKVDIVIDLPPAGGYQTAPIVEERILFPVHRDFHLKCAENGKYPTVALPDLLELPVVFINDAQYSSPLHLGPILRRLYEELDAVPNIAVQCCGAEMAHILSAQGLGFTAIPELFLRCGKYPELSYCEIAGHALRRTVCAIWSPARQLSADGRAFIDLLKS